MEDSVVYSSLCTYDLRNPYFIKLEDYEKAHYDKDLCSCDNCFYGRTQLAEEILKLWDKLDEPRE